MCVCLSVCLVRDAFRDCPLPGPFSATSPVPSIRIPKPPRKPVTAAVLTLQNDFLCHPIITVRSHFPSKPKKQGKKNCISPQKFSRGVGKFPALVGQSWQPQAGFADAGDYAGGCESEFSVKCWGLLGGKYLDKICWYLCNNWSSLSCIK